MAKVISLSSAKGGVGKSSCTVELASAIRDITGKKVLVVDLDENCSLSKNVGADSLPARLFMKFLKESVHRMKPFNIMSYLTS